MLQPLGKRILIKPIEPIQQKKSIILMKDNPPATFTVLAIGDDVKKLSVDDIIFLAAFSTSEITYNDEKFLLVMEDNVIAKVKA